MLKEELVQVSDCGRIMLAKAAEIIEVPAMNQRVTNQVNSYKESLLCGYHPAMGGANSILMEQLGRAPIEPLLVLL